MLLHIVPDEKFIDFAYSIFEEAYPGGNDFLLVSSKKSAQYIKSTPVRRITPARLIEKRFARSLDSYEAVILHSISTYTLKMVLHAPRNVVFLWIGFGIDYYDLITGGDPKAYLLPRTASAVTSGQMRRRVSFAARIRTLAKKMLLPPAARIKALNRIDYFCPVLHEDYVQMKKSLPWFTPRYLSWNYATAMWLMESTYSGATVSGDNILIGNSSSVTNNHLDIFHRLEHVSVGNRKVIVPLSYGEAYCKECVMSSGQKTFGAAFAPVVNFMALKEYIELLKSCSTVIMGHLRQQGLGNIIIALFLGARVYLHPHNPVYRLFKKKGATLFSLDDLPGQLEVEEALSSAQVEENRNVLISLWSRDVLLGKTKALIETLKNSRKPIPE